MRIKVKVKRSAAVGVTAAAPRHEPRSGCLSLDDARDHLAGRRIWKGGSCTAVSMAVLVEKGNRGAAVLDRARVSMRAEARVGEG